MACSRIIYQISVGKEGGLEWGIDVGGGWKSCHNSFQWNCRVIEPFFVCWTGYNRRTSTNIVQNCAEFAQFSSRKELQCCPDVGKSIDEEDMSEWGRAGE